MLKARFLPAYRFKRLVYGCLPESPKAEDTACLKRKLAVSAVNEVLADSIPLFRNTFESRHSNHYTRNRRPLSKSLKTPCVIAATHSSFLSRFQFMLLSV